MVVLQVRIVKNNALKQDIVIANQQFVKFLLIRDYAFDMVEYVDRKIQNKDFFLKIQLENDSIKEYRSLQERMSVKMEASAFSRFCGK